MENLGQAAAKLKSGRIYEFMALHAQAGEGDAAQRWAQQLLARWPARVPGPRARRMYASLARTRLQASAQGRELKVTPMRTLLRTWWAGRG